MSAASVAGPSNPSIATAGDDLAATTFKRLHPISYLSRFLDSSIREDGRTLSEFRQATLALGSISTSDGSAFVRVGNTSCIAAVKAEIAVPQLSRPREGYLIPNVELPVVCSSKFKPGAPADEAQGLTSRLLALLNTSNALNREQLCIEQGKAVWCLYLDISFICFDGNAMDAAVFAAVAALSDSEYPFSISSFDDPASDRYRFFSFYRATATLPEATFDPDTEQVRCTSSPSDRRPLQLDEMPFASSFAIFENTHLLSDPTAFESALGSSHITVAISLDPSAISSSSKAKPTVSFLHLAGRLSTLASKQSHSATDQQNLQTCIDRAYARAKQLADLLRSSSA